MYAAVVKPRLRFRDYPFSVTNLPKGERVVYIAAFDANPTAVFRFVNASKRIGG